MPLLQKVSRHPAPAHVWGNGHTAESDPTQQGWRCRAVGSYGTLLIGRPGVAGCATLVPTGEGAWDVVVHDDRTPSEVDWEEGDAYHTVPDVPGFGLEVIRLLAAALTAGAP